MAAARASIKDVASLARVSVGTVSNVLNNPDRVSPATRERVQAAVTKLGFVRNESARQLRSGTSGMIGLVVLDAGNPFFADVAFGAEQVITDAGYSLMLANSGEDPQREARHLDLFERIRAEGVLVSPVDAAGGALAQLRERGIPAVLVDRGTELTHECSVSVDDVTGGRLAAEHLLAQGHQRIAVVGGPESLRQVTERRAGAQEAVAGFADGNGRWARLEIIPTAALTIAEGRRVGTELAELDAADRPTGVFALNDLLALGLLQSLTLAGLRVPQDVALIGYDDIAFAAAATIPLSSVRQPRKDLGRMAAKLLLEEVRANGDGVAHEHQHVVFDPELVARASTLGR
ncbi:LacI family DNA-binding transcriptional regulator [Georgenia sp. MJ173]|uniref:LacI family DNA-binding transcriptional regulator n=1 Tax=Georgenia sunbinii TaxID=3117728 RepID=UPI002F261CDD